MAKKQPPQKSDEVRRMEGGSGGGGEIVPAVPKGPPFTRLCSLSVGVLGLEKLGLEGGRD